MPTDRESFTVVYDGEALQNNVMNVRDLAPALLALGNLLEQANHTLNGNKLSVSVNVKAFQNGCFGLTLKSYKAYLK